MRGFTLIELMIALALGLLVILGAVQGYLALDGLNRQKEAFRSQMETMLFVTALLRERVQSAGFGTAETPLDGDATEVTLLYARDESDPATTSLSDCHGRSIEAASGLVKDRFYMGDDGLFCDSTTDAGTTTARISSNVSAMTIAYRYRNAAGGITFHNDAPASEPEWQSVNAIRMALTVDAAPNPPRTLNTTVALRNPRP